MTIGKTFLLRSRQSIFKGKPFICSLLRFFIFFMTFTKPMTSCHLGKFSSAPKETAPTPMICTTYYFAIQQSKTF